MTAQKALPSDQLVEKLATSSEHLQWPKNNSNKKTVRHKIYVSANYDYSMMLKLSGCITLHSIISHGKSKKISTLTLSIFIWSRNHLHNYDSIDWLQNYYEYVATCEILGTFHATCMLLHAICWLYTNNSPLWTSLHTCSSTYVPAQYHILKKMISFPSFSQITASHMTSLTLQSWAGVWNSYCSVAWASTTLSIVHTASNTKIHTFT